MEWERVWYKRNDWGKSLNLPIHRLDDRKAPFAPIKGLSATKMKESRAKYDGYCKACMKYHIKAGQRIILGPTGWADPQCVANTRRVNSMTQHDKDKAEANRLGLHLHDYYQKLQEDKRLAKQQDRSWIGKEEFR